uniref:Uncharacterized protein n=1 Tax=Rhizophora mucronata TaxID=61149 RepID=A0A2P2LBL2_RHIMU
MGLLEYTKSIDWEHESYPDYSDYVVLPLFALFFPSVRFFLDRFVFEVSFLFPFPYPPFPQIFAPKFFLFLSAPSASQMS